MKSSGACVVGIGAIAILIAGFSVPLTAQPADGKGADSLVRIEQRLERIEQMLTQQKAELKTAKHQWGQWHRIEGQSDKDPYVILLNSETGRVKFLDPKTANVYEK